MKRIHKIYYADTTTSFKRVRRAFYRTAESLIGAAKAVSFGEKHTLLIAEDGTLWGAGANDKGQLGVAAAIVYAYEFIQLSTDTDWIEVAAGFERSIALKSNGSVWVAGSGNFQTTDYHGYNYNSWQPFHYYAYTGNTGYDTVMSSGATHVYAKGSARWVIFNHTLMRIDSQLTTHTAVRAVYSWGSFDHWETLLISKLFVGPNARFALGYDPNFTNENDNYIADMNLPLYFIGTLPGFATYVYNEYYGWDGYDKWDMKPTSILGKAEFFIHSYKAEIALSNNLAVIWLPYQQQLLCAGDSTTNKEDGTSGSIYADWTAMTWLNQGSFKSVQATPMFMLYLREHLGELWLAGTNTSASLVKDNNTDMRSQRSDYSWDGVSYYSSGFLGSCVKLIDNFIWVKGSCTYLAFFGRNRQNYLLRLGYNTYNGKIMGLLGVGRRWKNVFSLVSGPMQTVHKLMLKL